MNFSFDLDEKGSGEENMGRDLYLLKEAEKGQFSCRIYSWEGAWVSLGRFQDPEKDLLPDAPAPFVKRPTGGKGVLHGHDITLSIAAPLHQLLMPNEDHQKYSRSVRKVYLVLIERIIQAFRRCQIQAVLGENREARSIIVSNSDCFAAISPSDVIEEFSGQKICGCALRLTKKGVLLQASIPIAPPLVDPYSVFKAPATYHAQRLDLGNFANAIRQEFMNF